MTQVLESLLGMWETTVVLGSEYTNERSFPPSLPFSLLFPWSLRFSNEQTNLCEKIKTLQKWALSQQDEMLSSWIWFLAMATDSNFLLLHSPRGSSGGSNNWIPALHMWDIDYVLGSSFNPNLTLAMVSILGMNQKIIDDSLFISLFSCTHHIK